MAAGRGSGGERDSPPAFLEQVFCASEAAFDIVGRDQVVLEWAGQTKRRFRSIKTSGQRPASWHDRTNNSILPLAASSLYRD